MSDEQLGRSPEQPPEAGGHPKGTLAIVAVYGALFVVGWLVIYFLVFVPRGALTG